MMRAGTACYGMSCAIVQRAIIMAERKPPVALAIFVFLSLIVWVVAIVVLIMWGLS